MRLLNIKTGYIETVDFNYVKQKYVAISHRWLTEKNDGENELELSDLGLVGIGKSVNVGEKLYKDLYSKINKIRHGGNIQKYEKWNDYLNFFNNDENVNKKNVNNHHKLIKIINSINEESHCEYIYDVDIGKDVKKYDRIQYIWIDTLCIDKHSSAELSENIISMYQIYERAKYVYVYLNNNIKNKIKKTIIFLISEKIIDIQIKEILKNEWWSRAWTLQEYLANKHVKFYDKQTQFICNKEDIWEYTGKLNNNNLTGIKSYLFKKYDTLDYKSIGTIFSWMYKRYSTKPEDMAYSLMGLLKTYISPLYGEGYENAINRIINEYILNNKDDSIFNNISNDLNLYLYYYDFYCYNHNNFVSYNTSYIREIVKINGLFKITAPIRIIRKNIEFKEINKEDDEIYKKWCELKKLDYNFHNNRISKVYIEKRYSGILIADNDYINNDFIYCFLKFGSSNQLLTRLYIVEDDYYIISNIGKIISSLDLIFIESDNLNYDINKDKFRLNEKKDLELYKYHTFMYDIHS